MMDPKSRASRGLIYGLNGFLALGFLASALWSVYQSVLDPAFPFPKWHLFTAAYAVYHALILAVLMKDTKWTSRLITFDSCLTLVSLLFTIVALGYMIGLSPGRYVYRLLGPYVFVLLIVRAIVAVSSILYFHPFSRARLFGKAGLAPVFVIAGIVIFWFSGGLRFIDKYILGHDHARRHPDPACKALAEELFSKIACDDVRKKNKQKETQEIVKGGETHTVNIHYAYSFTGVFVKNSKAGHGMKGESKNIVRGRWKQDDSFPPHPSALGGWPLPPSGGDGMVYGAGFVVGCCHVPATCGGSTPVPADVWNAPCGDSARGAERAECDGAGGRESGAGR
ncbi:hypothetical protein HY522_00385 [bacterium]|nr:hypothetical protein [bacterium]